MPKKLGQHFLTSQSIASRIAKTAHITSRDTVLEIGPGKGILTKAILNEQPKSLVIVEKDAHLAHALQAQYRTTKNILVLQNDIRTFTASTQWDKIMIPPYKIVANIPYYLTSYLFRTLLSHPRKKPEQLVMMVQKEVAKRIMASPPHMNMLALSVQAFGTPKIAFSVSRKYFSPKPKVDSAVLSITDVSEKFFSDITKEELFTVIHVGFRHKRKLLVSNLAESLELTKKRLSEAFTKCDIPQKARAENLSLAQWKCLTRMGYEV